MFRIKEKLGGCCNSCCKSIEDNEECITITTYWVDAINREHDIMQMSLCNDCFDLLTKTLSLKENKEK